MGISIRLATGACLATLYPIRLTGCRDGQPLTGPIRGAFQMVDLPHALQTREQTPPAYPVQAVAVGSATLSWLPPTTNTDGTPLTNLAGYRVYWGLSQGSYPNSATLSNPGLTSYVVSNLSPGTYYFVATAYNSAGVESTFSGAASKTIQ